VEIRVAEHPGAELHCALCHGRLPKLSTRCDPCGTRMHFGCRASLRRCPTLGCPSGPHEEIVSAPAALFRPSREARKRQILRRRAASLAVWALVGCGAIAGLLNLGPQVEARIANTRRLRAQSELLVFVNAIALYRADTGQNPRSLSDLARTAGIRGWSGPYLAVDAPPLDPWGNEYVYRHHSGRVYELLSYGSNGVPGGQGAQADVWLWR
jgi:general secretion pathway protein G